jgi:hypothetical protein
MPCAKGVDVRATGLTLAVAYSGVFAYKSLKLWLARRDLRERALAKRDARDKGRVAVRRMLESHPELPPDTTRAGILSLSAVALAKAIKQKKFSCVAVMLTYCLRALDLGKTTTYSLLWLADR